MSRHFPFGRVLLSRSCSSMTSKPNTPCPVSSEKCAHDSPESVTENLDAIQKKSLRMKHDTKSMSQIPGPKGLHGLPLLGTILALHPFTSHTTSKLHLLFRDLHAKYGKLVLFPLGMKMSVLVFDPDLIDAVIRHEGTYPNRTALPILETYASRRGVPLFSIRQGEHWYEMRRPLQQGLSHRTVSSTLQDHFYCGEDLVADLGRLINTEGELHLLSLKRLLMQYVLEATAVITFNTRLNILGESSGTNQENEEFFDNIDEVFLLISKSLYTITLSKWYRTPVYSRFETAMDHVIGFCSKKIKLARDELKDHQMPDNLLRHLTKDHNMSDECIAMVMSTILFGGTEMTSQAMMWLLWILGLYGDKQEKLVKEIKSIQGTDGTISTATLQHMPYLKACVKEAFRFIFPTVNGSMRVLPEDIVLSDYLIPKGTWILFGQNALCRSPEYFDRPEEYIPERWMNEDPEHRRKMALCSLPFGFGKRNCVGRRLAEQQIYVAVIKILQRYKVTVPETSRNIEISYYVTARPDKDGDIRFTERTSDG